jgi:hypothetical protein
MIPTLTQLLAEIEDGEIPLADIFGTADCDSLLDRRDSDSAFDKNYREIWERNEKLKFILNRDWTEPVRKQSFLTVSKATEQHEIASCVSEDFELIAWESLALVDKANSNSGTPFVEWLYSQYKSGNFPCPPYADGNPNGNGG